MSTPHRFTGESRARRRGRPPSGKPAASVRTLDRGLTLLETLSEAPGLQLDVAHRIGLPPSTVFRLLEALRARGYVTRSPETGVYRVGIRAFEVGSAFVMEAALTDLALPEMRRLVGVFNEAVNLAVLDREEAVYVEQVEGNRSVRFFTRLGARVPLHCTGVGKVLTAWAGDTVLTRLLQHAPFEAFTPRTLTAADDFLAELGRVRELECAVDDEERETGVRCLAVPIRDRSGCVVAAMSLSGPTTRLADDVMAVIRPQLCQAADTISAGLGFHRTRVGSATTEPPCGHAVRTGVDSDQPSSVDEMASTP